MPLRHLRAGSERSEGTAMVDNMTPSAKMAVRKGLGEMLVEAGRITAEQLETALEQQRKQGGKLAEILVEQGLVTSEDIAVMLSLQLNMPLIDLKLHTVQPNALQLGPEETARKHRLVPLDVIGDSLMVVLADPTDIRAIEDVATQAKMRIQPAVGIRSEIEDAIDLNYKARVDVFAQVLPYSMKDVLSKMAYLFDAYIK